ncbi:hypothetical protein [Burkholderia phage BCSR5]|nr:hypothetical protein [Burkholderia phage BCSR5]
MTYHTYEDEQLAARADRMTKACATLITLLTQARSVDQLAENAVVTSMALLNGSVYPLVHALPVIDELKHAMEIVNNEMAHMSEHLNRVNSQVQDRLTPLRPPAVSKDGKQAVMTGNHKVTWPKI